MVELKDRQQWETKGKLLISPMPDVDGTGSGSLLDSILPTLLKNDPVMSAYILSLK